MIYFRNIKSNFVNLLCPTLVDCRQLWATYFDDIGVKAVFWSAVSETERLNNLVSMFGSGSAHIVTVQYSISLLPRALLWSTAPCPFLVTPCPF